MHSTMLPSNTIHHQTSPHGNPPKTAFPKNRFVMATRRAREIPFCNLCVFVAIPTVPPAVPLHRQSAFLECTREKGQATKIDKTPETQSTPSAGITATLGTTHDSDGNPANLTCPYGGVLNDTYRARSQMKNCHRSLDR